jgi:hypothetical protein
MDASGLASKFGLRGKSSDRLPPTNHLYMHRSLIIVIIYCNLRKNQHDLHERVLSLVGCPAN